MRDPNKFSIEQLYRDDCQFVVPRYQRGYDWKGNTEVKDLFSDFEACLTSVSNNELFLGTMIFDVSNERKGNIEIIDGQQRMTTLLITLIACREFAKNELDGEEFVHSIQQMIRPSDALLEEPRNQLLASHTVQDVFNVMCDRDWDGKFPASVIVNGRSRGVKRQSARLRPIYSVAYSEIKRISELDKAKFKELLRQILKRTYIIKIDIENRPEAFEIFERTNARGRGLEISDLLKNFLFSKNNEVADYDVEEIWMRISENADKNILRMLKYFWISRRGKISSRDLYRNIREYAQDIGIQKFCDELEEFSEYFKVYYSDEPTELKNWLLAKGFIRNEMYLAELVRSCCALKMFGITQCVPLIYSAIKSYFSQEQNTRNPKSVLTLVRLLEFYHFANNKVCDKVGNEVEKLYSDMSEQFYRTDDFSITVGSLKSKLEDQLVRADEFVGAFSALSYANPTEYNIIKYVFDMIINDKVKDGQRKNLIDYNQLQKKIKSSYDIEHILPRSKKIDDTEEYEYIDEIGNLLVIPRQINGILSNAEFHHKMKILLNPHDYKNNIKHVDDYLRQFALENVELEEWNEKVISERSKSLAREAYDIVKNRYSYR